MLAPRSFHHSNGAPRAGCRDREPAPHPGRNAPICRMPASLFVGISGLSSLCDPCHGSGAPARPRSARDATPRNSAPSAREAAVRAAPRADDGTRAGGGAEYATGSGRTAAGSAAPSRSRSSNSPDRGSATRPSISEVNSWSATMSGNPLGSWRSSRPSTSPRRSTSPSGRSCSRRKRVTAQPHQAALAHAPAGVDGQRERGGAAGGDQQPGELAGGPAGAEQIVAGPGHRFVVEQREGAARRGGGRRGRGDGGRG